MSKITIFNKTTGKFMFSGDEADSKGVKLEQAGHKRVDGAYGKHDMWDFATSAVIVDSTAVADDAARKARKKMLNDRYYTNSADLVASIGTKRSVNELNDAVDRLIEMFEAP